MKLTVNKIVGVYDKSKDGKAFVTKTGKPYKKATVTFTETGEKLVTVMVWTGQTCDVGQVFEGEITEREWNGNKYYDLKVVSEKDKQADELAKIKFSLAKHDSQIKDIISFLKEKFPNQPIRENITSAGTPVPTFVPNTPEQAHEFSQKMQKYEDDLASLDNLAEQHFNEM